MYGFQGQCPVINWLYNHARNGCRPFTQLSGILFKDCSTGEVVITDVASPAEQIRCFACIGEVLLALDDPEEALCWFEEAQYIETEKNDLVARGGGVVAEDRGGKDGRGGEAGGRGLEEAAAANRRGFHGL